MPSPAATHAVILAAGGSRRMGRAKALLSPRGRLAGETLLSAHIQALSSEAGRTLVVLGAEAGRIRPTLPLHIEVVENPNWDQTEMADSLRLALQRLPAADSVLITPVDAPPVSARVLQSLLTTAAPAIPCFEDQPGHPVLATVGPTLEALAHGTLADALRDVQRVPVDDPQCCLNLNTPQQWEAWQQTLSGDR